MPGSLLIADTIDVHSLTGLGKGDSTGWEGGGVSERWLSCGCSAKEMLCFNTSEGRL
jgi:hypothetical protein